MEGRKKKDFVLLFKRVYIIVHSRMCAMTIVVIQFQRETLCIIRVRK
jgi:hypothetical protein